jgi:collagen beta-1,O-galactosyltransferase
MREVQQVGLDWDLIYLGRKIMENASEPWVQGTTTLVHVDYAYWTLGYIISKEGAKTLVEEKPLSKLVPVDEYLVRRGSIKRVRFAIIS